MDEECTLEAHESEVLCLEFTRPETGVLSDQSIWSIV